MQTPPPDVDVAMKKGRNSSALTKRQIELKRMYKIMSENFFVSDDYVSIVHVLPHFQVKLIQSWTFAIIRLLNKPYYNEVILTRKNSSLKFCQNLETSHALRKRLDLSMLKIWGL